MKLSILIPAYDPGEWLKRLLDSLKAQILEHTDTEIIVVDDGSHEDLSYVTEYPAVRYMRKENGGEPSARNVCLKMANGAYIHFIDADDEISPDFLDTVYSNIAEGWDWVSYNWTCDGRRESALQTSDPLMINCAVWGYTFRNGIWGSEMFNEELLLGCDTDWLHRVLKPEHRHKHDDRVIYNYRWAGNDNSLCHRKLRGEIR